MKMRFKVDRLAHPLDQSTMELRGTVEIEGLTIEAEPSPDGLAPPCVHGQRGGDQFCIVCLRKRGDDALMRIGYLRRALNVCHADHSGDIALAALRYDDQLGGE